MEKLEDSEWVEAQKMVINVDLIAATKKHLQFLEAIDDNGKLYNGPVLERAVFRYKYYWLPLLAKHNKVREWQLVVPLDCEWIWHCHRLNPVRYIADCKELFGRILDPSGMVISSIEGACKKKTQELWNKMYLKEPYELGLCDPFDNEYENELIASESTKYDLVSAVKRQSSFYFQVSRAFMKNDIFLDEAIQRYKGFLHLIRRNMENKSNNFCVPTYDIDLIWHTHQLHPLSYYYDTVSLLGNVLDHDDNDSDRTKGQKLDVGFTTTTKQWTQMFPSRYWRAGAMYTNMTPANHLDNLTQSFEVMFVEIMVEIIEVRNYDKGNLVLSISKKQHDMLFNGNSHFNICTKTQQPQALILQCQPNGDLLFHLIDGSSKSLGTCFISLSELDSKLASPKWLEFESDRPLPITLGIVISMTLPSPLQCKVTKGITSKLWATGGMCSGSGGCGGCGGGGGCHASCGGCRASCGGGCGGGGNCSGK